MVQIISVYIKTWFNIFTSHVDFVRLSETQPQFIRILNKNKLKYFKDFFSFDSPI